MASPSAQPDLADRVRTVLDEVLDPCSVGRGVPAGLLEMGMVEALEVVQPQDGPTAVRMTLRLTSPGCTFQLYFERELRERLVALPEIDAADIAITWSKRFDWSDEEMSPRLRRRLREKRDRIQRGRIQGRSSLARKG